MPEHLLQTIDLVKSFPVRRGFFGQKHLRLVAVDNVNLILRKGETLGLVGESGWVAGRKRLPILERQQRADESRLRLERSAWPVRQFEQTQIRRQDHHPCLRREVYV